MKIIIYWECQMSCDMAMWPHGMAMHTSLSHIEGNLCHISKYLSRLSMIFFCNITDSCWGKWFNWRHFNMNLSDCPDETERCAHQADEPDPEWDESIKVVCLGGLFWTEDSKHQKWWAGGPKESCSSQHC